MSETIQFLAVLGKLDLRQVPCAKDSSVVGLGKAMGKPAYEVWLVPGETLPGFTPEQLARAGFKSIGEVVDRLVADGYPGTPVRKALREQAKIRVGSMTHWYYAPYRNGDGQLVISVSYGHPDVIHHVHADSHRENGRHYPWP